MYAQKSVEFGYDEDLFPKHTLSVKVVFIDSEREVVLRKVKGTWSGKAILPFIPQSVIRYKLVIQTPGKTLHWPDPLVPPLTQPVFSESFMDLIGNHTKQQVDYSPFTCNGVTYIPVGPNT